MIRKELAIFLVVGVLTVLVDYLSYRGIVWTALLDTNLAKGAGFLTGTVFAYYANRLWTFGARPHAAGSAWRFAALYTLTLLVNVYVNALMLQLLFGLPYPVQTAFVIATGLSATLNFLGMKHFVFIGTRPGTAT
jgi:putative flippase GtrA